jgi:MFS family permease
MTLGFGLSHRLWIVELAVFVNMLGYGAVLPFEIIYLHEARGFGLGLAGAVVGLLSVAAVVATPPAGTLIDRVGARAVATGAGLALAAGYAGLAFATTPAAAIAAATVAGLGNGAANPSLSSLVASLAAPDVRHRATAVARVAGNIGLGLGAALGGLVAGLGLAGFMALFLANAATYVVFVAILFAAVGTLPRPAPTRGGYRTVLRDRVFVHLALTNVALIAVGWGVLPWLVPPYADELGVAAQLTGLLFLANTATVVLAQVPIVKLAEGRSRVDALALAATVWVGACILLAAAAVMGADARYAALTTAAIAIGVGECLYAAAFVPLVADLAPQALLGRYMATGALAWWLGLALTPTLGAPLLARSATLALLAAAALSLVAVVSLAALDRRLPAAVRLTPRAGTGERPARGRGQLSRTT